jgi:hypothetical protein
MARSFRTCRRSQSRSRRLRIMRRSGLIFSKRPR